MKIIGIDPGKNTGYAVLDTDTMQILHMSIHEHRPYELLCLVDYLTPYMDQELVVERFVPRFGQAFDCTPMYLIGAMQGAYDAKVNLVMPATHKGSVPRAKPKALMKAQGFKIGAGHSLDALSLCLYWAGFKMKDKNVLDFLHEDD